MARVTCTRSWVNVADDKENAVAKWYVSKTDASDTNDGLTPQTALRSVHRAAELSAAGDEIVLGPGEWDRGVLSDRIISDAAAEPRSDAATERRSDDGKKRKEAPAA